MASASGQADVIDHTGRQAIQVKNVTGKGVDAVVENIREGVQQVKGEHGEVPPLGTNASSTSDCGTRTSCTAPAVQSSLKI